MVEHGPEKFSEHVEILPGYHVYQLAGEGEPAWLRIKSQLRLQAETYLEQPWVGTDEQIAEFFSQLRFEAETFLEGQEVEASLPKVVLLESTDRFERLIREVSSDPDYLHRLTPFEFEEYIAELLRRDGMDVMPTKRTRDRGVDMFAVDPNARLKVVYAYECKKNNPKRPVSVDVVRSFAFAVPDNGAHIGVICTTSRFTAESLSAMKRSIRLFGQELHELHAWTLRHLT